MAHTHGLINLISVYTYLPTYLPWLSKKDNITQRISLWQMAIIQGLYRRRFLYKADSQLYRRRKIKCDRKAPYANCVRTQVACQLPLPRVGGANPPSERLRLYKRLILARAYRGAARVCR